MPTTKKTLGMNVSGRNAPMYVAYPRAAIAIAIEPTKSANQDIHSLRKAITRTNNANFIPKKRF